MKENQQHQQWLDEIRNEMLDFEAPIPADGWERVSSSLPAAPKPMIGKRWMGIAASVMICAILGGGYYLLGDEQVEERVVAENIIEEQHQEVTLDVERQDNEQRHIDKSASKKETLVVSKTTHIKRKTTPITSEKTPTANETTSVTRETTPEKGIVEGTSDLQNRTEVAEPSPECKEPPILHKDTIVHSLAREEEKVLLAMNDVRKKESATWSYGLHIGGHGSLFDDEMSGPLDFMVSDPNYSDPTINDNPIIDTPPGTTTPILTDDVIDSKNHSSWSFGLSVDRQVWRRTTLESGLVYTLLTSDVKMRYSGVKSQRIHYLGIPVKLNYHIVGNQQCQFYASGGVMLERALSANRDGASIDIKPWQWSSNLSIGGQFRISSHISLYLEPGVNWYFNADPSVPSLRSESPVYFNLRGGIRLHR